MKEITLEAKLENTSVACEFVMAQLEELDCSQKVKMQLEIAMDELFSNVARYAYKDSIGNATIQFEYDESCDEVIVTLIDSGVRYNPLERTDPDVNLSVENREIGGLGIFVVKKTMDDMKYERINDQNVLRIYKKLT